MILRHPRLALDLDGVVVAFFQKLIAVYNERYNANLTLSDIDCELEKLGPEVAKRMIEIFNEPNWFRDLEPLPDAISTVSGYLDIGYQVQICTSPARDTQGLINGQSAAEKFTWVKKWLPFWTNDVIIAKHKACMDVDMLIDDTPYQIINWCKRHPKGVGFLIHQPWNHKWGQLPPNAVRGRLQDVANFINDFWCNEREGFYYRLDELKDGKL